MQNLFKCAVHKTVTMMCSINKAAPKCHMYVQFTSCVCGVPSILLVKIEHWKTRSFDKISQNRLINKCGFRFNFISKNSLAPIPWLCKHFKIARREDIIY